MELQLTGDVPSLTLDDYESVVRMYVDRCISIPGVRGIHQFGAVEAPGVSDIDLAVVVDDETPPDRDQLERLSIKHVTWQREPLVRGCFVHDVYVCPRTVFEQIDWLVPGSRWTLRAGIEEQRTSPTGEDAALVSLVHGLDFCIGRLHEFAHLTDGAARPIRHLIPQLWSLTHTRRILSDAGVRLGSAWDETEDALRSVRATPAPSVRPRDVTSLVPLVVARFTEAIEYFSAVLAEHASLANVERECSVALYGSRVLHVYGPASAGLRARLAPAALTDHVSLAGRTVRASWARLDLPGPLLRHHLAYLSTDTRHHALARRIARRAAVSLEPPASPAYIRVAAKRTELARRGAETLSRRGVRMAAFGIPGLPVPAAAPTPHRGTWRLRAVRTWLDWRLLPAGAVGVKRG